MPNIQLTLACGDYEIIRAIKEGAVKVDGVDLTVLTDIDSSTRHWRFLRNREFDVAEVSASSYLLARDAGMEIEGIKSPKDLIGKKVGVKSFQVSAILWMRGILEHEYGVPHKSIHWHSEIDEDIEFTPAPDLQWTRLADDQTLEAMLMSGELDAVIHSDIIEPYEKGDPNVARLFDDYKGEEERYFQKTGIFPIMHVMGVKRDIVERYPWIPVNLYKAFEKAKAIGMKRMFNPRIAPLAWYRHALEEQRKLLGEDPWEYGLSDANRHNLDTLVGYSHEQGMLKRHWPLDELFLSVSQGRKRGGFRV